MKTIFKQLGYTVSEQKESTNSKKLTVYFINNSDGTIRWAWPSSMPTPLFLKFYHVDNAKSLFFSLMVRLIFALRLQFVMFRKKMLFFRKDVASEADFDIRGKWALFTGTVGPNNKAIICHKNEKGIFFIKIATTENSIRLIEKEATILNRLGISNIKTFSFPEVDYFAGNLIQLPDVSNKGRRSGQISEPHINALIELNELSAFDLKLSQNESWISIMNDFENLKTNQDQRMPKGMIRKLSKVIDGIDKNLKIEVCMSHGDFTPWNTYVKNNRLHIYDWELADPFKPLGFDLFHFYFQQGILVDHKSWNDIKKEIDEKVSPHSFSLLSKFNYENVEDYLKLYFVFNTVYYLKLYSEQLNWHKQVYWMFNVWNDALSYFLFNQASHRELLIMDTFDYLLNKNYGAIKFQNVYPEYLGEYSDIDLCISKSASRELVRFFKSHPLIDNINGFSKSFMATHHLFCKDGSMLSMDLIWQIKRKGLELLDTKTLLKNSYCNQYGVKMLDTYDNARYTGLFYILNNTPIPDKYCCYDELLNKSENILDRHLFPYFSDNFYTNGSLLSYIKNQKSNTGLKGFSNKFNYLMDVIKMLFKNPGTVITFSGVDGAGKSTVIEQLKYKVEKQLRRRVIVLRHRPSILPIISSITKGRKEAERQALSNLPRTGNNKNSVSSLLRFAYYYIDYLIGQFVVQLKYVRKGYVVIYDRYYFDFMNDSRRSNITLPDFISKTGFIFLIKPKFNFFLYADSEIILKRKKELDKNTIDELTRKYLKQFRNLNYQHSDARYISINNVNLNHTLNTIFYNISETAA